ncbi:TonB-dependent receptor [Undibacterium sp. MH2W]|uniref:TonB-dependent receptor n=1 Tax=Undibacterium sp. MH2W TaxID=3413044 RepID=UPI003BF2C5BB
MKRIQLRGRSFALTTMSAALLAIFNDVGAQELQAQDAQKVEVTGSSIRRIASESSLPVTTISAQELEKRGMTTLADFMMALPQSFSLAPSNAGSGTNINLRGLGVNRTLVLLDGRRLANEATADGYANLDVIPMSAIARVEVLKDGASSIYGSDAIGGVVNFITKRDVQGASVSVQTVQPQKHGGGDEERVSATFSKGSLATDGWNWFATVDAHRRSPLAASDRAELSTPDILASLGRSVALGSGGVATPANFTTPTNKTAQNPYYATGCQAPYSIPGAKNTCILNTSAYGMALYGNQQVTFYTKFAKKLSEDNTLTVDYMRGEEYIISTKNPTTASAVNGVNAILPSTSKWYPGNSGGVPAVAGLNGAPLTVTWSVADLGLATTKDIQVNHRLAVSDEGRFGEWDFKTGFLYGYSQRDNYFDSGYVTGQGLLDGLTKGILNPFGLQDAAGKAYLKSISVDGAQARHSYVTLTSADISASREIGRLSGGPIMLALGSDFRRDTYWDSKAQINSIVTYAGTSPTYAKAARNVAAAFLEIDFPITKQLDVDFAARDDHFSDFGNTVNPKLSFRYQPTKNIMFRGSANTGFRAPTLFDRYGYRVPGANTTTASKWDDPILCPGGTPGVAGTGKAVAGVVSSTVCNTTFPKQTGSNPDLQPEKSKGFSLGLVVEPTSNITLSADYWHIEMTDMIANLPEQVYFLNPQKYANLFIRNPDGTIAYIKNVTMNLGGQRTSGIDVSATYNFPETKFGNFKVQLDGTYLTQFDNQLEAGGDWISNVGRFGAASNGTTSSFPIITFRWKHNLTLSWNKGDWNAQLTQNFNTGYHDQNLVAAQYYRDIESYSVVNLTASYTGFKLTVITAGVSNLFDAKPPLTNSNAYTYGYLSSAASPIGRAFNVKAIYNF